MFVESPIAGPPAEHQHAAWNTKAVRIVQSCIYSANASARSRAKDGKYCWG